MPEWALYTILVVFVLVVVALSYATFNGVKNLVATAPLDVAQGGAPPQTGGVPGQAPEFRIEDDLPAGWSEGRVTVLLMGIDERAFEQGPARTDTMILLTLDPATGTAGMISIPRDLWVAIPDYGVYDRINTAYFRGQADQYPGGGGAALARLTVQHNLGVEVPYYATVNFQAFIQIIDQIGCIPITVPQTIDDPTYPAPDGYGYDPFYLEAGEYCMGGETLLKYSRTRSTFGGDFDRAARQQQVLRAIREHVLSTGQLPNLLARAPQLYETVSDGISTNLSLQQIVELARLAASIQESRICSAVINNEYVDSQTLPDGSQVLVPNRNTVRQLVLDVWTGQGTCDPTMREIAEAARAEGATISILNGTAREGLATITRDRLAAVGIQVTSIGNAERSDYAQTIIINHNGKDATARFLAAQLGVAESLIAAGTPGSAYDIEVILGEDYRP
ncbi:MAG: hypothetical protein Kow00124_00910 [Anaerolineae bacterium]